MTSSVTTAERPLWTEAQEAIILNTFMGGASREDAAMLLEVARVRRLCPFRRHIFFVKRYDRQAGRDIWSFQVSIDGLRFKADESGVYAGQDEIITTVDDRGRPIMSKCVVWRTDRPRGFVGVARWEEFAQTKEGRPIALWASKPFIMLEKCAEALALRRAFPELGGAYTDDEMPAAEHHEPPRPAPRLVAAQHLRPSVLEAIAPEPPPSEPAPAVATEEQERAEAATIMDLDALAISGTLAELASLARQIVERGKRGDFPPGAKERLELARADTKATIIARQKGEAPPDASPEVQASAYKAIEAAYLGAQTKAHFAAADKLREDARMDGAISVAQSTELTAPRRKAWERIVKSEQPAREPGEEG